MQYSFIIHPSTYQSFNHEDEIIEQCKQWGLISEKATKLKAFYYRGNGLDVPCRIVGFVDNQSAVIKLENQQFHCIHPSYLKEMQASTFGQKTSAVTDVQVDAEPAVTDLKPTESAQEPMNEALPLIVEIIAEDPIVETPILEQPKKGKAKKEKAPKLELPEEKVKMTATVKEFTTVPNNFSDNDDEVIIYEAVSIEEPALAIGDAWSSHSATMKKLELEIGDTITFEAKIVAKKLTKHPVPYKINNPSKIQKQ
jgi:hypothetical protein